MCDQQYSSQSFSVHGYIIVIIKRENNQTRDCLISKYDSMNIKILINKFKLRTDQLWLVVILAGFAFYTSLVPLPPNDFWWHLKIGEIIHIQNLIPDTNMFSWALPADYPFVYGAWLAEYLFYSLHQFAGLEVLIFLRNIIAVITFGLVGIEAQARSGSWRISALVTAITGLMVLNNLPIRPQIWSWIPYVLYLILLRRFNQRKINKWWLALLPMIMVFWVNAHGAFILGLVLIGVFFISTFLQRRGELTTKESIREIGWIGSIGILTTFATVVNPRFIGIFSYVLDLMTDAPSQRLVEEWQSPTPTGISNIVFYLSILLLITLLSYSQYKLKAIDILLIVPFLWLAWSGQRYVIWYAIISTPMIAELIGNLSIKIRTPVANKLWKNTIMGAFIFLPVVLVQPWFVERLPLPESYQELVLHETDEGPLISVDTPIAAVDYLRSYPGGRLFNEMGYGSYMIWSLPEQKVFVDPRVELYPYDVWQDYIKISRSIRYRDLIDEYGINRILLKKDGQEELSTAISSDPDWELEYNDDYAQVWTKPVPNDK